MHAPEPWTLVRTETPEYYVYEINAGAGHVASIVGWTHFGTICPITAANAQLICKAPALLRVLNSLMEWSAFTGGWNASCRQEAQDLLAALQASLPSDDTQGGGSGSLRDHGGVP
jgi:hypothetical protein